MCCGAGVDSSAPALALAEQNAQLNSYSSEQYTFLKDDIAKYMQQQIEAGSKWDLIVLDPPKLAPNRKSLDRALAKYRKLNTLVSRILEATQDACIHCCKLVCLQQEQLPAEQAQMNPDQSLTIRLHNQVHW